MQPASHPPHRSIHNPSSHHPPSSRSAYSNYQQQQQQPPAPRRNRSASDPFSDPVYPSAYQARVDNPRSAPLPPPKPQYRSSQRRSTDTRDPRMLEAAVRDAVTVRPEQPSRARVGRSQTGGVQSASGSKSSPVSSRRSYSQDSVTQTANAVEKSRRTGKPKKGSTHADVIDRLDFTGVGPMFHHDGPFDACMPSRNRHKSKAPMLAWSAPPDEHEDPSSAAQFRAAQQDRRVAVNNNNNNINPLSSRHYDSPYAIAAQMASEPAYQAPKKQVDRIAEAWGIHEPEPYEEFFSGGGGQPNGESGLASAASSIHGVPADNQRNRRGRDREYGEYNGEGRAQPVRRNTKTKLPPPQPIFIAESVSAPGDTGYVSTSLPSPGISSPGAPKRSKSLMQKFRKMRDAPNVPVAYAEAPEENSPPSSFENYSAPPQASNEPRPGRPSHRHQNSFFGRFGRNQSASRGQPVSPTAENSEQYVYAKTTNKALPPRPPQEVTPEAEQEGGYFDAPVSPGGPPMSPGGGLNRKTSLLKKVKGVVRNAAAK